MGGKHVGLLIPDTVIRSGIEALFEAEEGDAFEIITFKTVDGVIGWAENLALLIVDISGQSISQVEANLNRLIGYRETIRVIVISNRLKVLHIRHIMQLGAKGFVFRDDLADALMGGIKLVLRDVVTISGQALQLLTESELLYVASDLKSFDMAVLRWMSEGYTAFTTVHN